MMMIPQWTAPSLSLRYDQPIAPVTTWFSTIVNYQGDAGIERKVTEEVASFGKQLGIVSEALLEVAGDAKQGPKLKRLRKVVAEIESVKRRQHRSLAREAADAFAALVDRDRIRARRLIHDLHTVLQEAEEQERQA
jgi:hypothetical protein